MVLSLFSSACFASEARLTCTVAVFPAAAFSRPSTAPSLRTVSICAASVTQAGSDFAAVADFCSAMDAVDRKPLPSLAHPARPAATRSAAGAIRRLIMVGPLRSVQCWLIQLPFVCPVVGVRQTSGKCTSAFAQRIGGPTAV
jgi:hypothetical protein